MELLISSSDVVLALVVVLATLLLYCIWMAFHSLWWTPLRVKRLLEAQGIRSMPWHFFYGNLPELNAMNKDVRSRPMLHISHNIVPHVLPHYHQWIQKYGYKFVHWHGAQPYMFVTDIDDAKEILSTKLAHFPRLPRRPDMVDIVGNGLVSLNGEPWALHRRILSPAFFLKALKAMVPTMVACTTEMIKRWDSFAEEAGQEIDVNKEFKALTADIIAHTGFGSNYAEGKQVFEMQHEQFKLADTISRSLYIPGARFIPTAFNRQCWKVDKEINEVLRQLIEKRLESSSNDKEAGKDLLGLLIAANNSEGNAREGTLGIDDIIDECKTFFIAGHDSTATLLTWTCLLLAIYPEWQERVRAEVQAVVGATDLPTANAVHHLKLVGMVLNEALRLYPPAVTLLRKAASDTQLGKMMIPKGTVMIMPIIAWHHDERYWGPDANEFRPERFSEGVANACKVVGAFVPFSTGPQNCIGQTFALLKTKVVLSMILQRYSFRPSPAYKHAPMYMLTLQAQYGVPIFFEKL